MCIIRRNRIESLSKIDIQQLLNLVIRRKSLKGSTLTAFFGKRFACLRNFYSSQSLKNLIGFKKGDGLVEKSLEVEKLIQIQTDVQILKKNLFSNTQRNLMKIQRLRTINLDSTEQSDPSIAISSKEQAKRLMNVMKSIQNKRLTELDKKLILGVIGSVS